MIRSLLSCAFLFCLGAPALAEDVTLPDEARHALQKVVGTWDCVWTYLDEAGNEVGSVEGTEEVAPLLDPMVMEMTTAMPALGRLSKAWYFYNPGANEIQLSSVSSKGEYWFLKGPADGSRIVSDPVPQPDGSTLTIRFTHSETDPDHLGALMEYSADGGETWTAGFRQTMVRRAADD